MKKNLLKGLLSIALLGTLNNLQAQTPWQSLGANDGMVNGSSDYSSIAVDTNNVPFIAFSDLSDGSKLKVKKFNGTTWDAVGMNPSVGSSTYVVMGIDRANVPHVLFRDGSAGSTRLTLVKFDGTNWVNVGSTKFTPGNSALPDLAFAPDNTPYVSFVNYATGINGKASVMKFDGTSWSMVGTPFSGGAASSTQIEVDNTGIPYCAYSDASLGGWAEVKKFENNTWTSVGTSVTSSSTKNISLQLKSNGTPVIGFSDATSIEKISVKEFNGTAWVNIGAAGFSVSQVGESSYANQYKYAVMTLGRDDNPIVGYTDIDSNYYMTVMRYDGTSWSVLGTQPAAHHRAKCVGLAVDKANNVYGSYTAAPTGNSGPWPNYAIKYNLCESLDSLSASATSICFGDTVTLTANGILGTATDWEWTTGTCNGTVVGTGAILEVIPSVNTTYFLKASNGCVSTCESVAIDVTTLNPVIQHQSNNGNYTLSVTHTFATYQWYRNGQAIAGATNATYETNVLALYAVEVTGGDCTVMSEDYNLAQQVSVVNVKAFENALKVYPTPTKTQLNIDVIEPVNALFYSIDGKIVKKVKLNKGNNNIDITSLSSSMYMLHFVDNKGMNVTSFKFTKE